MRVLFVADDPVLRDTARKELSPAFELLPVNTFALALPLLDLEPAPTVIVLDLGLADARGAADFLAVAARESEETLRTGQPTEELVDAAVRSMPQMVMQKFHNLADAEIPHRFYEVIGAGNRRIVRLTPELQRVAASEQLSSLTSEVEARWRIVETSFSAGVGTSLISDGLTVDLDRSMLTDKLRRRSVTGVTSCSVSAAVSRPTSRSARRWGSRCSIPGRTASPGHASRSRAARCAWTRRRR